MNVSADESCKRHYSNCIAWGFHKWVFMTSDYVATVLQSKRANFLLHWRYSIQKESVWAHESGQLTLIHLSSRPHVVIWPRYVTMALVSELIWGILQSMLVRSWKWNLTYHIWRSTNESSSINSVISVQQNAGCKVLNYLQTHNHYSS